MQPQYLFLLPPNNGDWIVNHKIDGYRLQILVNKETQFWGRRLEQNPNWSEWKGLQDIKKHIEGYSPKENVTLDCELMATDGNATSRLLCPSLKKLNKSVKPIIYVFDIVDQKNLFHDRISILSHIIELFNHPDIRLAKTFAIKNIDDINAIYKDSLSVGGEGIVFKDLKSKYIVKDDKPYETPDWLKCKTELTPNFPGAEKWL